MVSFDEKAGGSGGVLLLLTVILAVGSAACGSRSAPVAGLSSGVPPDLRGHEVMVFPVQTVRGGIASADAELAHALRGRGSSVGWLMPGELREFLARAPGVRVRLDALPVGMFMHTEVNRVGDPLYGDLRRLAALTGSDIALIPVEMRLGPETEEGAAAVEIAVALINARNGRVFWFGIVDGEPGSPGDPHVLASAAEALARTLVR